MTDLLKITFGTAALLFGWTLLEEYVTKTSAEKKANPSETPFITGSNPFLPTYGGSLVSAGVEHRGKFTVAEIKQIYPQTVPLNQFEPVRRVGVYTQG